MDTDGRKIALVEKLRVRFCYLDRKDPQATEEWYDTDPGLHIGDRWGAVHGGGTEWERYQVAPRVVGVLVDTREWCDQEAQHPKCHFIKTYYVRDYLTVARVPPWRQRFWRKLRGVIRLLGKRRLEYHKPDDGDDW